MSNSPTALASRSPASGRHGLWRLVGALARAQRALLVVVVLGVVGAAVAGVVPPLVVRHVVNTNVLGHRASGLWWAGVIYVGAVAARSLCSFVYNYAAALAAQRMIVVMRVRLFTTLASVATSYLDATPIGDTISRATSDVETIDTLLTDGVTTLVGQLVALVAVAFTMIVLSPTLSAVSFVVLPPLVLASRWLQRRVRASERATRVAVGELNAQLSESVGGRETIRAFDRTETFVARFRAALARTLVAQETSVRYGSLFTPVSGLLSSLAIAALLWVGSGALIAHASTNLGTLTAFVLLFQGFFAPIVALGDQWNAVQAALAGAERVLEVLELPVASPPSRATAPSRAEGLVLRDVSFSYPGGEPVLRGVSVSVAPGERVALVGRTGSG
jgi:ATP-binding cassette subfamily B protein